MIAAKIKVMSDDHTLAQLEARIGVDSGSSGHTIGDLGRVRKQRLDWSSWVMELELDPTRHAGVDGLDAAIATLPLELASNIAALQSEGCTVVLDVEQRLTCNDPRDHGFHLSAESLRWLATAGALLDLDQYTDPPPPW